MRPMRSGAVKEVLLTAVRAHPAQHVGDGTTSHNTWGPAYVAIQMPIRRIIDSELAGSVSGHVLDHIRAAQ